MKNRYISVLVIALIIGAIALSGCTDSTTEVERKSLEANQQRLINSTPLPKLTDSLERENIAKRLEVINDRSKLFYIYLFSYDGKLVMSFTGGKVSSLNSYLTTQDTIAYTSGGNYYQTQAPDLDGSYGENVDGIFFFNTQGGYVEWNGMYMMSEYPLSVQTPADLVMQIEG